MTEGRSVRDVNLSDVNLFPPSKTVQEPPNQANEIGLILSTGILDRSHGVRAQLAQLISTWRNGLDLTTAELDRALPVWPWDARVTLICTYRAIRGSDATQCDRSLCCCLAGGVAHFGDDFHVLLAANLSIICGPYRKSELTEPAGFIPGNENRTNAARLSRWP